MKNIIKILAIATLSLNLLQAKATLSIDGYMPKMLFMKVKDGGTVYVDDEKKGMTSANGPLIVQIQEGEHNVKVCFYDGENKPYKICGEQKVYVADDTQASISIKAKKPTSLTELEKCQYSGDMVVCNNLGYAYSIGKGVAKDPNKAAQLYQKACDGGEMLGCRNLGYAYSIGKGVAKDPNKAAQLYQKACDGGEMGGCGNLANAYEKGDGVTKDLSKAAQLYEKACDGGDMRGCSNLAITYEEGRGVTKDLSKAAQLYKKACDGGEMFGCIQLGIFYQYGRGVTEDLSKAAQLYEKACDGGEMLGCDLLRELNLPQKLN